MYECMNPNFIQVNKSLPLREQLLTKLSINLHHRINIRFVKIKENVHLYIINFGKCLDYFEIYRLL